MTVTKPIKKMPKHEHDNFDKVKPKRVVGPMRPWTAEEEAVLMKGVLDLSVAHAVDLSKLDGLDNRDSARVNVKIRGMFKKILKNLGADADSA